MNAKRASSAEPATAIGVHRRTDTQASSPTAHMCLKSSCIKVASAGGRGSGCDFGPLGGGRKS